MAEESNEIQPLKVKEELTDRELETQMLIGVCGAQAAGKTVFLTSVFQSIHLNIGNVSSTVLFDRDDKGGAYYFEKVEKDIRAKGGTAGTLDLKLAQLHFKPSQPYEWYNRDMLPVNLFDFAGGDFSQIADLKNVTRSVRLQPEQKQRIFQINEYLEKCDGLIILIDSGIFKPGRERISRDGEEIELPFPNSVRYTISSCIAKKRPLALVFTKMDMNPTLTIDRIKRFPVVEKMLLKQFTPDHNTAFQGQMPYGFTDLITCYEVENGRAKIRDESHNIWTPSAANIFLNIMKASLPRFRERYTGIVQRAERKRKDEAAAAAKAQQDRINAFRVEKRRKTERSRRYTLLIIALVVLLGSAFFYWNSSRLENQKAHNNRVVERVATAAHVTNITSPEIGELKEIITNNQSLSPGKQEELWQQLVPKINSYLDEGLILSDKTAAELERCRALAEMLPPRTYFEERNDILSSIDRRSKILTWWNEEVKPKMEMENNLKKRLSNMYKYLTESSFGNDPQLALSIKRAFAVLTVESIMGLEEDMKTRDLLKHFFPAIDDYKGGPIPYLIVYKRVREIGTNYSFYKDLYEIVQPLMTEFRESTANRRHLVDAIFMTLFRDIDPGGRQRISNAVIRSIKKNYIFHLDKKQWVTGVSPTVDALENDLNYYKRSQQRILTRYFNYPFYQRELETLFALICQRYYQYSAIRIMKSYRNSMEAESLSLDSNLLDPLEKKLEELNPQSRPYLKETAKFFKNQGKNLRWIRKVIDRWNRADTFTDSSQRTREKAKSDVKKHLKDLCIGTWRPEDGDCEDVH